MTFWFSSFRFSSKACLLFNLWLLSFALLNACSHTCISLAISMLCAVLGAVVAASWTQGTWMELWRMEKPTIHSGQAMFKTFTPPDPKILKCCSLIAAIWAHRKKQSTADSTSRLGSLTCTLVEILILFHSRTWGRFRFRQYQTWWILDSAFSWPISGLEQQIAVATSKFDSLGLRTRSGVTT